LILVAGNAGNDLTVGAQGFAPLRRRVFNKGGLKSALLDDTAEYLRGLFPSGEISLTVLPGGWISALLGGGLGGPSYAVARVPTAHRARLISGKASRRFLSIRRHTTK